MVREEKDLFKKQIQLPEKNWETTEVEKDIITREMLFMFSTLKLWEISMSWEHIAEILVYPTLDPRGTYYKLKRSFNIWIGWGWLFCWNKCGG